METRIVAATENNVAYAAELIRKGELVVFPTETVYGLGANAFDPVAVEKIFKAKGRPQDNPLIVHISSVCAVSELAVDVPDEFYALAEKFMPGPLTVVLKKSAKVPDIVTAGGDTVGIRMPDNEVARRLIAGSFPIAAPSANRSKHVSPTTAKHVYDDLAGEVPLILDGGSCKVGIESTVLDLASPTPTILRPGAVTAAMLLEVLGEVSENGRVIKIARSPGMKYTHYAPRVPMVVADDFAAAIREYDAHLAQNPVIIARERHKEEAVGRNFISFGESGEDCARNLYNDLRMAEDGFGYIVVERLEGEGIEASAMNRILKAAGGRTV